MTEYDRKHNLILKRVDASFAKIIKELKKKDELKMKTINGITRRKE